MTAGCPGNRETAAARGAAREVFADILRDHEREQDRHGLTIGCSCGSDTHYHRGHVADVLAASLPVLPETREERTEDPWHPPRVHCAWTWSHDAHLWPEGAGRWCDGSATAPPAVSVVEPQPEAKEWRMDPDLSADDCDQDCCRSRTASLPRPAPLPAETKDKT